MKKELLLALSLMATTPVFGADDVRDQARRMFASLTGTVPNKEQLDIVEAQIRQGKQREAARSIIDSQNGLNTNGAFYNIVLKNMVSPWTSKDGSLYNPLNDMSATVIGVIRDERIPFKDILWQDVLYTAKGISPKFQIVGNGRGWQPVKDCRYYNYDDEQDPASLSAYTLATGSSAGSFPQQYSTYASNDPEIQGRFIYKVGFGPAARDYCRLTKYIPIAYQVDENGKFIYDEDGNKVKALPPDNEQIKDGNGNPILSDPRNTVIDWLRSIEYVSEYIYLDAVDKFIEGSNILAHNNAHYDSLEALGIDLGNSNLFGASSQMSTLHTDRKAIAGLLSTRGFGEAFITAGTNRAPVAYSMKYFMCKSMEELNDPTTPRDYNRKDVDRSPGGDSKLYENHCIGCHGGMDSLSNAFAFYDFPEGKLEYEAGQVPEKVHRNVVYPEGYEVATDVWFNYWSEGKNSNLGWGSAISGSGAESLGRMFSETDAFHGCMVDQVFETICYRKPATDLEKQAKNQLKKFYIDNNYNMKKLFIETSIVCMGK